MKKRLKSRLSTVSRLSAALLGSWLAAHSASAQSIPRPNKVVVVMMENSTYTDLVGNLDPHTGMPWFNSLMPIAANMTKSVGNTHPTDPNYLYFISGANQGITSNTDPRKSGKSLTTPNIPRQLRDAGFSFVDYAQGLATTSTPTIPVPGPDGGYFGDENVVLYWLGTGTNQVPTSCLQPIENIPADYSQLPAVSFWHAVEDHTMHQGFTNEKNNDGDNWLKSHLANYANWAMKNNSLLIVTWDESDVNTEDPALYNHIATLFVGPMVNPGNYSQSINHINVCRTLEDMYGLPYAGAAGSVSPISAIWDTTPQPVVSIDSPTVFSNYTAPATINLSANVAANGHSITKVQFYNGSTLLGESTAAPYTFTWSNVPTNYLGYSLSAKVTYDSGSTRSSAPVNVGVYPSAPLASNLVAYLGLDGNLSGQGGTTVNGTIFPSGRTARYVTGKFGQAASFQNTATSGNPVDWSVSLGNLDSTYAGNFTVSTWIKTTSQLDGAVFGNKDWTSGGNTGWVITTYASAKTVNWKGASGNRHDVGLNPPVYDGNWHLVTVTFNRSANQVICYIDGKPHNLSTISSTNGAASLGAGLNTLIGGSGTGTESGNATLDDVAIWSRVLSPIEVANVYTKGQAGNSLLVGESINIPTVALTSPAIGASYQAPATVDLAADVTPNGHTITKVQFFNGTTLLGEDTSAPYTLSVTGVPVGNYSYKATVIYDSGSAADSSVVPVSVTLPLSDSLASYLNFDNNIAAQGGTTNNGTVLIGTPRYATGKFGQAASFQNTNGAYPPNDWAVSLGSLENIYAGSFTVSMWERTTTTADGAMIGNKDWYSGGNVGWVVSHLSGRNVNWNTSGGSRRDVQLTPPFNDGTWHLVTVTFDRPNNQVITYLDGVVKSTNTIGTVGTASLNAGFNTLVGSSGNAADHSAYADLDDLAMWTRVLSAAEVSKIFNRGQTGQSIGDQLP